MPCERWQWDNICSPGIEVKYLKSYFQKQEKIKTSLVSYVLEREKKCKIMDFSGEAENSKLEFSLYSKIVQNEKWNITRVVDGMITELLQKEY